MKIKWLGVACFLITGKKGLKIITDPYQTDPNIKHTPVTESIWPISLPLVMNTRDHNYTVNLQGKPEIIRGVGNHIKGIDFLGIGSYHDNVSGAQRGPNKFFVFQWMAFGYVIAVTSVIYWTKRLSKLSAVSMSFLPHRRITANDRFK